MSEEVNEIFNIFNYDWAQIYCVGWRQNKTGSTLVQEILYKNPKNLIIHAQN